MFSLPHSLGMVPSSMAVTQGAAICCPSLPAKTDVPGATLVASSAWPQASWKMTPPKPPAMTTGISPAAQYGAVSIVAAA